MTPGEASAAEPRAAVQNWALVNAAGQVVAQVVTDGRTPWEDGSHRGRRYREVRTDRQGDPSFERIDPETGAWIADEDRRAEARRKRASPAERVESQEAEIAKMRDQLAALTARVDTIEKAAKS